MTSAHGPDSFLKYAAMKRSFRSSFVLTLLLPAALTISLSGCTLLGLGAAAGAAAGGCAMLDANEDDVVTQAELSEGLFDNWDADEDGLLTEKEFDVGSQNSGAFVDSPGGFDSMDEDGNDRLTEAEFEAGVSAHSDSEQWADARCDELGL